MSSKHNGGDYNLIGFWLKFSHIQPNASPDEKSNQIKGPEPAKKLGLSPSSNPIGK